MVKVDLSGTSAFFDPAELDFAAAAAAHRTLSEKSGAGSEFTGWLELPQRIRDGELKAILAAAQRIRGRSKALVVIGIGGSYLGARGAIELLRRRRKLFVQTALPRENRIQISLSQLQSCFV